MTEDTHHEPERRQVHRVTFHAEGRLHCPQGILAIHISDLSLKGALVTIAEAGAAPPPISAMTCRMELPLDDEIKIECNAHVVRQDGRELGLHIDELDLESIQHLRRLIELNLGDPELLNRDLAALFQG